MVAFFFIGEFRAFQNVVSGPVTMITLEGGMGGGGCDQLAAAAAAGCGEGGQVDRLQEEIARLRLDKLELLRQNVSARHEVRRLRERETQLQADLHAASREIHRLREQQHSSSSRIIKRNHNQRMV